MIGRLCYTGPPAEWEDPDPPEFDLMSTEDLWAYVDFMEAEGLGNDSTVSEALAELERRNE
jgi:hypothetical protein